MPSFIERFAIKKKNNGANSIQQEVILESMQSAQESLAAQVSQANSSITNVAVIISNDNNDLGVDDKSPAEAAFERELEENSLDNLLSEIELATSQEELSALLEKYEELLAGWSEKISLLRSEKALKEYLSIVAALGMLQQMAKNSELLPGKKLSEILQNNLKSQQPEIESRAKLMQVQNQALVDNGKLGKTLLSDIKQAQQALQQTLRQVDNVQQSQLNVNTKQVVYNVSDVMKAQIINSGLPLHLTVVANTAASIANQAIVQQAAVQNNIVQQSQSFVAASRAAEQVVVQQRVAESNINGQAAAQQSVTQGQAVAQTVMQQTAVQQTAVQGQVVAAQAGNVVHINQDLQNKTQQPSDKHLSSQSSEVAISNERQASFAESSKRASSAMSDIMESTKRKCECANHVERVEQSKSNAEIRGF